VTSAFTQLPKVMAHADSLGGQIDRAVIDLAEAVMLQGHEGQTFEAVVVDDDDESSRIQLRTMAIVATIKASGVRPGDVVRVKLTAADSVHRSVHFDRVA